MTVPDLAKTCTLQHKYVLLWGYQTSQLQISSSQHYPLSAHFLMQFGRRSLPLCVGGLLLILLGDKFYPPQDILVRST